MSKGAIWSKWDLHIHTPSTILNNNFKGHSIEDKWNHYINEIEKLEDVKVLGITDYYSIDGYLYMVEKKKEGRMKNIELILPNIELRLNVSTKKGRPINYHLIINPDIVDKIDSMILSNLKFNYQGNDYSCNRNGLIDLGRAFKNNDELEEIKAYKEGVNQFKVSLDNIINILKNEKLKDNVITAVANSNQDGNSGLQHDDSLRGIRENIYYSSDMIFSSTPNDREFFLGKKNKEEYVNSCGSIKPCIHGSDAHEIEKICRPDKDRYTWIKADTTFNGLKQILNEPEERVFIGYEPDILAKVKEKPSHYIERLAINNIDTYNKEYGIWFDNIDIPFSYELTAIIGNKGNGKSALADVVGLLGNSKNQEFFSFLNEKKFKKDKGKLSKKFEATLYRTKGEDIHKNLNDEIDENSIEIVKYIPQSFFEKVTNNLDESFEKEIKDVIFSHIKEKEKIFSSFDDLIDKKTKPIRKSIDKKISELKEINRSIIKLEEKRSLSYVENIKSKIKEKKEKIASIDKPKEIKKPEDSSVDKLKMDSLELKSKEVTDIESNISNIEKLLKDLNEKLLELEEFNSNTEELKEYLESYIRENNTHINKFNINIKDLLKIEINTDIISNKIKYIKDKIKNNEKELDCSNENSLIKRKDKIEQEMAKIRYELDGPNREYQKYLEELKIWEELVNKQIGDKEKPDTLEFYKSELEYISTKLSIDLQENRNKRMDKCKEIFLEKEKEVSIYRDIKNTIDKFISDNEEHLNEFKISLNAGLNVNQNFYKEFFNYIDGNKKGSFKSKNEKVLLDIFSNEINIFEDVDSRLSLIIKYLENDMRDDDNIKEVEIKSQLKKDKYIDFYNYIFSLEYLEPHYELRLDDKNIEELSPGEKGALLLVFYLLLDTDDIPLVIDQPEDNLDNQSIFKILVPFIKKAKKRRQIIMVTHNPNLAVVADAEQIICVDLDKKNNNKIDIITGAIENNMINKKIVEILEGTMPAFITRNNKYLEK
nr:AAA family ATPase [uncultured Romboutsia sp.]